MAGGGGWYFDKHLKSQKVLDLFLYMYAYSISLCENSQEVFRLIGRILESKNTRTKRIREHAWAFHVVCRFDVVVCTYKNHYTFQNNTSYSINLTNLLRNLQIISKILQNPNQSRKVVSIWKSVSFMGKWRNIISVWII